MEKIERLIQAKEVLQEYKSQLLKYYTFSYGKEYQSLLQERMAHTIYLFDSPPDITLSFVEQYQNVIEPNQYEILKKEAEDYLSLQKEIVEKQEIALAGVYCQYFGISRKCFFEAKDRFLSLPIQFFSSSMQKYLQDEKISVEEKDKIEFFRTWYQALCSILDVTPLENGNFVDCILQAKEKVEQKGRSELISRSLWGQRIQQEIEQQYGFSLASSFLSSIVLPSNRDASCAFFSQSKSPTRLVFLPLMKIFLQYDGDIDALFFHENRHAMESPANSYSLINEIRTEKHAIEDSKTLPTMFSRGQSRSLYQQLFPLTENLFEEYQPIFDHFALTGDNNSLDQCFGKLTLDSLEAKLDYFFERAIFCDCHELYLPINRELVVGELDQLRKNAVAYQKSKRRR